jgi:hypothetical protein
MAKLSFALGGYKFWTDNNYLYYRSIYGKSFRVLKADISSVSLDEAGKGKNNIKINGHGTTLAEEELPKPWAQKAQDFILNEIKDMQKEGGQPKSATNLDDLERLATLKEKGVITQEEFEAKKKQLLGI